MIAGPAGQRERPARRHDMQPPLWVKCVGEAEQVVLVSAAAVVQYQQALRVSGGRSEPWWKDR